MEKQQQLKPLKIHYYVSATDSEEFKLLSWALNRSSVVALDAEWKPIRTQQSSSSSSSFPTVSLLQIACRVNEDFIDDPDLLTNGVCVFLVDLLQIRLSSIWVLLKDMFISPDILKLGFRFKQDLIYLSSSFCSQGCIPGFDKVEPFLDITSIDHHLQHKQLGRRQSRDTKSLATICEEVLGVSLSKELQCSDWSQRPLTEDQKTYAAADAQCLLEIFSVFQRKVLEGNLFHDTAELQQPNALLGLKEILVVSDVCENVFRLKFCQASDIVRSTTFSEMLPKNYYAMRFFSRSPCIKSVPLDIPLLKVVRKFGEKILLKESDRKPRTSRRRGRRHYSAGSNSKEKQVEICSDWQGPPPWDLSIGGDGCPKFLCDVMVEGLAKHLRCVGIDAATPRSRKPGPRQLMDHAQKEKRVLLTRDAKLLRHDYLISNQVYKVKSLLKNDQLLEMDQLEDIFPVQFPNFTSFSTLGLVIKTFELKISEDKLMSRCTKCNGGFIQKPLSTEEAIEAAKGFQVIPDCLFNKKLEFWQCTNCNQLYWEGTQYHNAIQKFIDVCKLKE